MRLMKVKVKNAASRRTQGAIRRAFAELLVEKQVLSKITVAELAERAGITRGTFYTHYNNMYEVAEELESEVVTTLLENGQEVRSVENVAAYFRVVFDFLRRNEDLYRVLLSSDTPLQFVGRLEQTIYTRMVELARQQGVESPNLELGLAFFSGGVIYTLLKYFRGELAWSLDDVQDYLVKRCEDTFVEFTESLE